MRQTETLSVHDISFYEENGYLVLPGRIPAAILAEIRTDIARFEDEARGLSASNDRLDLEDSHTPDAPRLRRIKLPHMISDPMRGLLYSDHILAPVRDLIGPDLRLHTSKLNMKSAQYGAAVEWHQDFAFYPHTNDDVLAVAVVIDDMAHENGPLKVFAGSHRRAILDHHCDGVFVGAVDLAAQGLDPADAVELTGPAGSISIHHGHILHGSARNTSGRDRRLLFYEMMAADAFPIVGGMTRFDSLADFNSRMLCGSPTLQPRLRNVSVRIPQPPPDRSGSIYEIQDGLRNRAFAKTRSTKQ